MKIDEQIAAEWTAAFAAAREAATSDLERAPDEQILDCLKRHGVAEPSCTMASFQADLVANFGENAVLEAYDRQPATGLDLTTEEATTCRVTPWA